MQHGLRVTIFLGSAATLTESALAEGHCYQGKLASMSDPRQKLGWYWGYQTRIAAGVGALVDACPFEVGMP